MALPSVWNADRNPRLRFWAVFCVSGGMSAALSKNSLFQTVAAAVSAGASIVCRCRSTSSKRSVKPYRENVWIDGVDVGLECGAKSAPAILGSFLRIR